MDKNSVFGEVLEKGQTAVTNTVSNTASSTANDISQTVSEQLGAKPKTQQQTQATAQPQVQVSQDHSTPQAEPGAQSSEATREMVEDFYSPSDNTSNNPLNSTGNPQFQTEEKLAKVRQELLDQHKTEYYDPLFAYENKKPEPTKADVMEQEDAQKMQELAVAKQQGNDDIAKTRAQIAVEANRGVAG